MPKPFSQGGLKTLSASLRLLPSPLRILSFEEAGLFETVICDFPGFRAQPGAGSLTHRTEGTSTLDSIRAREERFSVLGVLGSRHWVPGAA